MGDELWRLGALQLAEGIRSRRFSSREVVQAHLDRIAQVNGHVNAVVKVLADSALAAADGADAAVRAGAPLGAFHGVPFTIKENIDIAGQPTTSGVPIFAGAIAPETAPAVERMLAAGRSPSGARTCPTWAFASTLTPRSTAAPRTRGMPNERRAGPAEGGGGPRDGHVADRAGQRHRGLLRNPAHACGIVSIKPSRGVVPDTQAFPTPDRSLSSQVMLNQGVMARTVADVRAGLETVAGHDPRDPVSVPAVLTDLTPGSD